MKFRYKKNNVPRSVIAQPVYVLWFSIAVCTALLPVPALAYTSTGNNSIRCNNLEDILPLRLLAFSGTVNNDIVLLKWTTASEKNINHFEAEKSTNGVDFSVIARQIAVGVNETPESYQAEDFKPASGINYYRLKIVGNDNKIAYSKVIMVKHK